MANLAYDIFVGESDYQPVLGRIVLITILDDKTFPCVIIRLSLCEMDNTGQLDVDSIQYSSFCGAVFSANRLTGTDKNSNVSRTHHTKWLKMQTKDLTVQAQFYQGQACLPDNSILIEWPVTTHLVWLLEFPDFSSANIYWFI